MPTQEAAREQLRNNGTPDASTSDRDSTDAANAGDRKRKRVKVPSGSDQRKPDAAEAGGGVGRPEGETAASSGRVGVRKSEDDYCYICAGNGLVYFLSHSSMQ